MGFVDLELPRDFSNGSTLGPSWNTTVKQTRGGGRFANQGQSRPLWRYDIVKSLLGLDAAQVPEKVYELVSFFNAVRGALNTWKLWDPIDHSTLPDGKSSPSTSTDGSVIGAGDASTLSFQLVKRYNFGNQYIARPIMLPVSGTTKVWIDDTEQTEGTDFSVGLTSGLVTFTSAPASGAVIKAACQFFVHAAFTEEADRWLAVEGAYQHGEVSSLPVVEVASHTAVFDVPLAGGAKDWSASPLTADHSLSFADGMYQRFKNVSGSAHKLWLPPKSQFSGTGGPIFYVALTSDSTQAANLWDVDTTTLVKGVGANQNATVILAVDSVGNREWRAWT